MPAPTPATRPALSFYQFFTRPFNVAFSCFGFLNWLNQANPFVSRQWRNIFPYCLRLWGSSKNFSQIRWQCMHRTSRNFFGHYFSSIDVCITNTAVWVRLEPQFQEQNRRFWRFLEWGDSVGFSIAKFGQNGKVFRCLGRCLTFKVLFGELDKLDTLCHTINCPFSY